MKHPITQSHNGVAAYVDLIKSPAATQISIQPHLLGLVKEVIRQTNLSGPVIRIEQDMGRDVGYDFVIETAADDPVFYAQLVREKAFTRFVKNGKPLATRFLTIILIEDEDGGYQLHNTWIGKMRPSVPGSDDETEDSKPYWLSHAYVFDRQPVQSRTLTKDCPY